MPLDKKLLEILACPACKGNIKYQEKEESIYCQDKSCGLIYPVRDGIPVMLIDEATKKV